MSKVMLVNVTHVEESRVAVLDQGVLDAYEIETSNRAQLKGNIYNAVVESVHPSLEAAFLRISPDLKGFLPLDEVNFNLLPTRGESRKSGRIGQHLHPGQKLMAQVVREPFAGKPPTVSTYFSLPGRFLVLMPGVDSAGVSRKIEDPEQRDRLKTIVQELRLPDGFGVIVRTAGLGQTKLRLQRDLRYLLRLWQSIQRASVATEFPNLVYREADLVIRTIRDHLTSDISEVWIDSKETYEKALAFVRDVMPSRAKTLRLYTGDRPLFNKFNLEEQIESIYQRRVQLPSGGEIVIDGTEALTAVDVNSARSKQKRDAEENATQTNVEAAAEIARQLRLRDLGGLVVIDFIDMLAARNKKKVEDAMREAMRGDKAKHDVTRISKLGLVEIARQRLRSAKMGAMYTTCPTCEGYGLVKNLEAAAIAALRKLQTRSARGDLGRIQLALPPDVAGWMLNFKRDDLVQIERRHQVRIDITFKPELLRHECEVETFVRQADEEPAARVVGDRVVPPVPPSPRDVEKAGDTVALEPATEKEPAPAGPRPRRRRRSGGTPPPAEAEAPASKATPSDGEPEDSPPDGGEEATDSRPRRKRRRRRRSRQSQDSPETQGSDTPPPAERDSEPGSPPEIPRGVRADELMPAAVAGGSSSREKRSKAGGRRRRPHRKNRD